MLITYLNKAYCLPGVPLMGFLLFLSSPIGLFGQLMLVRIGVNLRFRI